MKKAYAQAGVDVDLGNRVKSRIPGLVKKTHRSEVLGKIGGFGGLFSASFPGYKEPVLVSSIDGVGTKLKVAAMMEKHETVGEDLVNHCINDIAVLGAEPLYFLDYLGIGKLEPKKFEQILAGITRGCAKAGCALIGGETAQMPGVYHGGDYDLVGVIVGLVEKKEMIDGSKIKVGDIILGIPSNGLHTNGYSLARQLIFDQLKLSPKDKLNGSKKTIGEELLAPHVSYLPQVRALKKAKMVKGLAHITGGGLIDNPPRILPKNVNAVIQLGSWPISPLFKLLADTANVSNEELYQTFNMGIGMIAIVDAKHAVQAAKLIKGIPIGTIRKGSGKVLLK